MKTIDRRQKGVGDATGPTPQYEQVAGLDGEAAAVANDPTVLGAVALHEQVEADSQNQKLSRAEQVAALQQQITGAVEALIDAGAWKRMLQVAARFHDYSFGNQLLISLQCPDATRVAGYRAWQKLGRQVRKDDMRRDPLSSAHAWCVTVSVQKREEVSSCLS